MKTVTLDEWQAAVRNGYAGLDWKQTSWMLYLDESTGATVWGQVEIVR
jgi:hypothetical protein